MSHQHIIPLKTYYVIFAILMALLVVTVGVSYLPVESKRFHLMAALFIATVKAVLIVLYFMHVRYSNKLTWVFSSAAFVWLAILIILTVVDYDSREWIKIPGK